MIRYMQGCQSCDVCFEIEQSIKDEPLSICENCAGGKLHRLIPNTFLFAVKHDPQTVGHLAARNTEGMGRYELEERRVLDKLNKVEAKKAAREELSKKLPKGASLVDPSQYKTPWWRSNTTSADMSLNKLSPEKKEKYIMTGEK